MKSPRIPKGLTKKETEHWRTVQRENKAHRKAILDAFNVERNKIIESLNTLAQMSYHDMDYVNETFGEISKKLGYARDNLWY